MPQVSAGLLMYRFREDQLQFFLVHPGGPYFAKKQLGHWTIPKGLVEDENLLEGAIREFSEETGLVPAPSFQQLGKIKMKSGKIVHSWAFEGVWQESKGIRSNTFSLEWPPKSGKVEEFPEVDQAAWFDENRAKEFVHPSQVDFIDRLINQLSSS